MITFNPETGDILSQLKTFKTLCAAFSARVCELVGELNGEYGLRGGMEDDFAPIEHS